MNRIPSLFMVEQYLAGELNPAEFQKFEELMTSDPSLKSYVQLQQGIRYNGPGLAIQPQAVRSNPVKKPVFSSWWEKAGELLSPLLPPQVAWAMGLCLLAGAVLVLFRPDHLENAVPEFTAKGSSVPFHMRVGGQDFQPEQSGFARAGDTMTFVYRSLAGMHVQIWYQDDGGALKPYLAPSNFASSWPGSSAWHEADYKVVLFSDWKKESIWVLWSEENFNVQDARSFLEGRSDGDSMHKAGFQLVRSR